MKTEEILNTECHKRFKMSCDQYIELLTINDIRGILLSLFESQANEKELQEENKRLKEENFQLRLKCDNYDNDNPVTCTICGEHFKSFEDAEGHRCSIARNLVVPKISY